MTAGDAVAVGRAVAAVGLLVILLAPVVVAMARGGRR